MDFKLQDIHFERCPRCGAVVAVKKGSDIVVCDKCKAKIKMKK